MSANVTNFNNSYISSNITSFNNNYIPNYNIAPNAPTNVTGIAYPTYATLYWQPSLNASYYTVTSMPYTTQQITYTPNIVFPNLTSNASYSFIITPYTSQNITSNAIIINSFTTTTYDPYFSNVILLLHGDNNYSDSSSYNAILMPANSGVTITSTSKFGTGALSFNATTNNWLNTYSSTTYAILTNNFTIEFWIYVNSTSGNPGVMGNYVNGTFVIGTNWGIWFTNGSPPTLNFQFTASVNLSSTITLSTWHHVAFVRNGTAFAMFVDGNQVSTYSSSSAISSATSDSLYIGGYNQTSLVSFNGYLDEVRVTIGIARYTTNFTPPTTAFPNSGIIIPTITSNILPISSSNTSFILPIGGASSNYTSNNTQYYINIFSNVGLSTFIVNSTITNANILVVAGGGGGGDSTGGGGGAGGLQYFSNQILYPGTYPIIVGAGGYGGNANNYPTATQDGGNGSNSQFGYFTPSIGGGGGTGNATFALNTIHNGGSGGGTPAYNGINVYGGLGTYKQGNAGGYGTGYSGVYGAGGGGGAGSAGTNGTSSASGNGGNGLAYSITGSNIYYAGGGAGGGSGGIGGIGGGGNPGSAGASNTGGGGGGASSIIGGAGGSGIVIVQYTIPSSNIPATISSNITTLSFTNAPVAPIAATPTGVNGFSYSTYTTLSWTPSPNAIYYIVTSTPATTAQITYTSSIIFTGLTSGILYTFTITPYNTQNIAGTLINTNLYQIPLTNLQNFYTSYNGISVSSWADLSGNNYTLTQSTQSLQPVYKTSPKPALYFTGTQIMTASSFGYYTTNQSNITVCVVALLNALNSGFQQPFSSAGSWIPGSLHLTTTSSSEFQMSVNDFTGANNDWHTGLYYTSGVPFKWIFDLIPTTAAATFQLNGGTILTYNYPNGNIPVNLTGIEIGNWSGDTTRSINGNMYAVFVYNRLLSTQEKSALNSYIYSVWGI